MVVNLEKLASLSWSVAPQQKDEEYALTRLHGLLQQPQTLPALQTLANKSTACNSSRTGQKHSKCCNLSSGAAKQPTSLIWQERKWPCECGQSSRPSGITCEWFLPASSAAGTLALARYEQQKPNHARRLHPRFDWKWFDWKLGSPQLK